MRRLVGALVGLTVLILGAVPASAVDLAPGCPAGPDLAYTGSDDAAQEARMIRREAVDICNALVAQLHGIRADTGPLAGSLLGVRSDVQAQALGTTGDPVHVTGYPTGPTGPAGPVPGSSDESPAYVRQVVADASRQDAAATALHGDLWILAGLLVGLPFAFFFLREVLP